MGKKVIVYIINFFLVIAITVLASLLIFSNTILSKQYMIDILQKNDYYNKTDFDIKDMFKNYIMQSGLEEGILEGLYDKDKLNNDINMIIDGIYENKEVKIDTDGIRNILNSRIDETLKQNHRVPDKAERESIQIFVNTIVETYEEGVVISQSTVNRIGKIFVKLKSLVEKALIATIIVIAVLVITIIAINKNIQACFRVFGASILSCGIIFSALKLLIGKRLHYVLIINNTFSDTLINLSEKIVNLFFTTGIVMAVLGISMIVIGSFTKGENRIKTKKGKH